MTSKKIKIFRKKHYKIHKKNVKNSIFIMSQNFKIYMIRIYICMYLRLVVENIVKKYNKEKLLKSIALERDGDGVVWYVR